MEINNQETVKLPQWKQIQSLVTFYGWSSRALAVDKSHLHTVKILINHETLQLVITHGERRT